MFDTKSDYALNKVAPDAIVYLDATGEVTQLTLADFSSLEEFQFWKAWSDENYHNTEKINHIFYNHTRSLHGLFEQAVAVPMLEEAMMEAQERQEMCQMRILLTANTPPRFTLAKPSSLPWSFSGSFGR